MRRLLVNIVSYICSLRKWLEWKRRTHKLVAGEVHFWPMREQDGSGGSSSGEGGRWPKDLEIILLVSPNFLPKRLRQK